MFLFLSCFIAVVSAKNLRISEERVYHLQCLLEEKSEPCQIVTDESFSRNISLLSPQVVREIYKPDSDFIEALESHNFTDLNEKSFESVPPGIMLMLPASHLSMIKKDALMSLIFQWQNNKIVFKHLIKAIFYSRNPDILYEKLLNYDFSDNNLRWIAEVISLTDFPEVKHLIGKLPLLFYSPPEYILNYDKYKKFYLLSIINKPEKFKSVCSSECLLRFWAYRMIKFNFPEPLENWVKVYTNRWGYVLTGSTIEELNKLGGNSFDDFSEIFSYDFSPIQVRLLYDNFNKNKTLYKRNYGKLPEAIGKLLPQQLVTLPNNIRFHELTALLQQSHSSAFQILEIMKAENLKKFKFTNSSYPTNKFVYVLPLEFFNQFLVQNLSVSSILQMQSKYLTKSQLYFLSNGGTVFNFKSKEIFKYTELLRVLPASDIMFNRSASHVLLHLLANADPYNIPQVYALLNKLWPEFSSFSVFEDIFTNNQPISILEYFPTRYVLKYEGDFLKLMQGDNMKNLPDIFVESLSKQFKESNSNFNFFNLNKSYSFLYSSLSCEDISSLDPYYFTYTMSNFNKYRILSGKVFPKRLQHCCINKFLELLELKYLLFQGYSNESKLSLLNEAEIDALGGYIFSALPVNSISKSRNARVIIKSIGSLSLYELLSATSLNQLSKLSSVLFEAVGPNEKISSVLFDLGNLTLFLENKFIEQINQEYFKLLLESNYIDHRLCADQETRTVWYNLIKNSFGESSNWSYQTLITLGDFLITVPLSDLDKINEEAWIYAADVINTKYYDRSVMSSGKNFYEICLPQLSDYEKQIYTSDLKKLITTLVHAAQLQLDTVVSASDLLKRKENNESEFSFVDFKREIKLSFSSEKTIVDNYTDFMPIYSSTSASQQMQQPTNGFHQDFQTPLPAVDIFRVFFNSIFTYPSTSQDSYYSENFNSESNNKLPYTRPSYAPSKYTESPWSMISSQDEHTLPYSSSSLNIPFIFNGIENNISTTNYSENISESTDKTTQNIHLASLNEDILNISVNLANAGKHQLHLLTSLSPSSSTVTNSSLTSSDELKINSSSQLNDSISYGIKNNHDLSLITSSLENTDSYTEVTNSLRKNIITDTPLNVENMKFTAEHLTANVSSSTFYLSSNNEKTINSVSTSEVNSFNKRNTIMEMTTQSIPQEIKSSSSNLDEVTTPNLPLSYFVPTQLGTQINEMKHSGINNEDYFTTINNTNRNITKTDIFPSFASTRNSSVQNNTLPTSVTKPYEEFKERSIFAEQHLFSHPTDSLFQSSFTPSGRITFNHEFSRQITNTTDVTNMPFIDSKLPENVTKNEINHSTFQPIARHTTVKLFKDFHAKDKSINLNIANLLNMKSEFITEFIESDDNSNKLSVSGKNHPLINNKTLTELGNGNLILEHENKETQTANKNIKLFSKRRLVEIKPSSKHSKRSIKKWTCAALKMVGKSTEIIMNGNIINSLDNKDLMNCIDLFSEMDLSKGLQSLIWERIHLENIVLAGKLVAASNLSDIENTNFLIDYPWAIEKIFLLAKYNTNEDVRQHLVKEVLKNSVQPFPVELVVSMGSLVCELPEINSDIIEPNVLLKSSVVLGKALPCNFTCLSKLSNIATHPEAFNDPSKWTFGDVYNLGIMVSGLNASGWKKLVYKNYEALSGLSEAAFECLPYKHIKMMKKLDKNLLSVSISNRLEEDTNKKIKEFNFLPPTPTEVASIAVSSNIFFLKKNILISCFVTLSMANTLLYFF